MTTPRPSCSTPQPPGWRFLAETCRKRGGSSGKRCDDGLRPPMCSRSSRCGSGLQLAAVYLALSEPTTAQHLLREVDDILRRRPALGTLVEETEKLRARVSAAPAAGLEESPLTPAELRVLPYLQTHLTFAQIAQRLYISRNTVATHVHAIYRKLAVSSRDDAVQRATAAGMLGG